MNGDDLSFNRGAVKPMECLSGGWNLIKDQYWLFLGITFVGIFLGSLVPLGILMGATMCGIYLCLLRRMERQEVTFDMLFQGFNYFVQGLVATLIMIVPMIVLMVPLYVVFFVGIIATMPPPQQGGGERPPPSATPLAFFGVMLLFMLALMVIGFIVGALFLFTYPLIVDRKLSGWDAVRTSFNAVFANFGGVAGLMIINFILSFLGMMACYVGAIFVMPITFAAQAVAYRQVFPAQESPLEMP